MRISCVFYFEICLFHIPNKVNKVWKHWQSYQQQLHTQTHTRTVSSLACVVSKREEGEEEAEETTTTTTIVSAA